MTETDSANPEQMIRDFLTAVRPLKTNADLVRLGSKFDGGYLVPDDLADLVACFSPGVSKVANFELDMARRGIPCFLADYSVEAPPVEHDLFHFEKKFLGQKDEGHFITLDDWVARNAPKTGDMILQMDIEGAEYPVLETASLETLRRFRIIVIEFHALGRLLLEQHHETLNSCFTKLLADFDVVHIHPNNCCGVRERFSITIPRVMEFTFLRKDRITTKAFADTFPHPLDAQNVRIKEDIALPDCWYSGRLAGSAQEPLADM